MKYDICFVLYSKHPGDFLKEKDFDLFSSVQPTHINILATLSAFCQINVGARCITKWKDSDTKEPTHTHTHTSTEADNQILSDNTMPIALLKYLIWQQVNVRTFYMSSDYSCFNHLSRRTLHPWLHKIRTAPNDKWYWRPSWLIMGRRRRGGGRHDICQIFRPSDFTKFWNLPKKRAICNIFYPKYWILSIPIHIIEMITQFASLYSDIELHPGLNILKFQQMHNDMWNFTRLEIILH